MSEPGVNRRMIWPATEETRLRIEEGEIPEAPPGGAVLKIRYCGICRSDCSVWHDNWFPDLPFPRVMGHEIGGHIHSLGSQAVKGDFKVGDTVTVYSPHGCGSCSYCRDGLFHHCLPVPNATLGPFYGITEDGGFQEYLAVHRLEDMLSVPDSLPLDVACLLTCGGLTAYNALVRAGTSINYALKHTGKATLMLVGIGGLGMWALHLARQMWTTGLTVIMADVMEDKLSLAKQEGADRVLLMERGKPGEELANKVREVCGGGIDGSLDFVGTEQTLTTTFYSANKNCRMMQIGITEGGVSPHLPLGLFPLNYVSVEGSLMGSKAQLQELIELASKPEFKHPPITHVGLGDVNEVFERLLNGTQPGRAVIDMTK